MTTGSLNVARHATAAEWLRTHRYGMAARLAVAIEWFVGLAIPSTKVRSRRDRGTKPLALPTATPIFLIGLVTCVHSARTEHLCELRRRYANECLQPSNLR